MTETKTTAKKTAPVKKAAAAATPAAPSKPKVRQSHHLFRRDTEHSHLFVDVVVFGDARKALTALGTTHRGYEYVAVNVGQSLNDALKQAQVPA